MKPIGQPSVKLSPNPSKDPIPNGENELEVTRFILRNQATSNLSPKIWHHFYAIHASMQNEEKLGSCPNVKPLGPIWRIQAILLFQIGEVWIGSTIRPQCKLPFRFVLSATLSTSVFLSGKKPEKTLLSTQIPHL